MLQRHKAFDLAALNTALDDLEAQARHWLTEEGIAPPVQRLARFADLRYANQGYEITVPIPEGPLTTWKIDWRQTQDLRRAMPASPPLFDRGPAYEYLEQQRQRHQK